MRAKLKGKKSYIVSVLAIGLGVLGVATGEMTWIQGIEFILGGGALAAARDAIG
jgi:hypothetical protein